MKKIYILALASLLCSAANVQAEVETTSASVKMTYVNYDEPDEYYGAIPEGECAKAGYNKIVAGGRGSSVEFVNTGWGANWITYLQVDASAIKGNILSAELTFEASGSLDSKRTTGWGVGYNTSTWSADMTYNTAITGIITMGDQQWTTTKSANEFESFTFDISTALKKASNGVATILVYETAAAGGYIKNPKVEVKWTTDPVYDITFKETAGVAATVTMDGKNVTNGVTLTDGTYEFSATAEGYQDYSGEFTVEGAKKTVEFTMTENPLWSYTVKNNVNDEVKTGTVRAGMSATVAYSRYIIAEDGLVWMKDATNKEYNYSFKPDANDYVETLEYTATDMYGVYFVEGEDIEGMTVETGSNANIRCSNAAGGYAEGAVTVCTLKAGTYNLAMGVFGNSGATFTVKAGEETILTAETANWWWEAKTEEAFTLGEETAITFEGAVGGKPLDYILITDATKTAVANVEAVKADGKWYNLQGVQIPEPTQHGLYIHNGKKVIVK